jgi:MFS family permease
MLALAAAPSLLWAFPAAWLVGLASIGFLTASTAIVQVRAAPEMRGRVLALQAMVFLGSTPIGGPVLGAVCEAWGARAGLVVGGVACFVAAAIGSAAVKRSAARPIPAAETLDVTSLQPV